MFHGNCLGSGTGAVTGEGRTPVEVSQAMNNHAIATLTCSWNSTSVMFCFTSGPTGGSGPGGPVIIFVNEYNDKIVKPNLNLLYVA